jgi:hypothetical protein
VITHSDSNGVAHSEPGPLGYRGCGRRDKLEVPNHTVLTGRTPFSGCIPGSKLPGCYHLVPSGQKSSLTLVHKIESTPGRSIEDEDENEVPHAPQTANLWLPFDNGREEAVSTSPYP